jgi:DNA-binding NarL/FixJ family response regulator
VAEAEQEVGRARVLVVDDSPVFLDAAASIVLATPSLDLVGVAASGARAIELLPELKPDLVLLDIHMPDLDGIETAAVIRAEQPDAVVVLVSAQPEGFEASGRAAGAKAVLAKRGLCPATLEALWAQHRPGR